MDKARTAWEVSEDINEQFRSKTSNMFNTDRKQARS